SQAIALDAGAKAPADGYTLVMATQSGLLFLTASRKSLPYDPFRDFAHVTLLMFSPFFLTVGPAITANSVQDFIALVKANPGKYFYGSIGVGSGHHLVTELFKTRTGTEMTHVPFKAGLQAHTELLSGQIQVYFEGPGILTHIRSGRVRALATTGAKRAASAPDLPTLNETVLPGFDVATWFGL